MHAIGVRVRGERGTHRRDHPVDRAGVGSGTYRPAYRRGAQEPGVIIDAPPPPTRIDARSEVISTSRHPAAAKIGRSRSGSANANMPGLSPVPKPAGGGTWRIVLYLNHQGMNKLFNDLAPA